MEEQKTKKRKLIQVVPIVLGLVVLLSLLSIDFVSSEADSPTGMAVATGGAVSQPHTQQCKTDLDCPEEKACVDTGAMKVCLDK